MRCRARELTHCGLQSLGIALSSHRLDVIERVFEATKDATLLEWVLQIVVREGVIGGSSRSYKNEVRSLIALRLLAAS